MKLEISWFFDVGEYVFVYGWEHMNTISRVKLVKFSLSEFHKRFGQFRILGLLVDDNGNEKEREIEFIYKTHIKALKGISAIFDKSIYTARNDALSQSLRVYESARKELNGDVQRYREKKKILREEYKKTKGK